MTTAREKRIQNSNNWTYRKNNPGKRTGQIGELWQIKLDAKKARMKVDQETKASAKRQAEIMRMASGVQQAQAVKNSASYKANLAISKARTKAATEQAQGYLQPWRQAGTDALGKLQSKIDAGPGEFKESPGYQFRQDEAQKAVERSAAARGGVLSGRAIKESQRYSQNLATEDYDNFLRRYYESMEPLERMSGHGMTASTQMGNIGMTGARDQANEGFRGTQASANEETTGVNAYSGGQVAAGDIIAQQEAAKSKRDYAYAAFQAGEDF